MGGKMRVRNRLSLRAVYLCTSLMDTVKERKTTTELNSQPYHLLASFISVFQNTLSQYMTTQLLVIDQETLMI